MENRKRDRHLVPRTLRKHGLTVESYRALVVKQGGRCRICDQLKSLIIDHDHATKLVRGLICRSCNTKLGVFESKIDKEEAQRMWLEQAQKYLFGGVGRIETPSHQDRPTENE